jgi:hypothetical protein
MNSPSNSPLGGPADERPALVTAPPPARPDLLTPVAFALYAGRGGKVWVEIAGGGQKRH